MRDFGSFQRQIIAALRFYTRLPDLASCCWQQSYTGNSTTETTDYIGGLLDLVSSGGVTDYRHYINAGSEPVAVYSRKSTGVNTFSYVLSDHQGSIADITNSSGSVDVQESFTPFGNRRNPTTWSGAASNSDLTAATGLTRQAYTFQTQLGLWMGLNHMNGRVQDAVTGRFLSADPNIPDLTDPQSYNRYAYVQNNPLTRIDPSGFEATIVPTNSNSSCTVTDLAAIQIDCPDGPPLPTVVVTACPSCMPSGDLGLDPNPQAYGCGSDCELADQDEIYDAVQQGRQIPSAQSNVGSASGSGGAATSSSTTDSTLPEVTVTATKLPNTFDWQEFLNNWWPGYSLGTCIYNGCTGTGWAVAGIGALPIAEGKVLQTGSKTVTNATARALNKYFGMATARREWGRALEALKEWLDLPNDFHGKIMSNGNYVNPKTGEVLGNLREHLPGG